MSFNTIWEHDRKQDWLVEVGFGNGEEAAVSLGSNRKYERLSSQHSELTHKLSRMRHKQTSFFFTINHPLINMKEAGDHKLDAHFLENKQERVNLGKI